MGEDETASRMHINSAEFKTPFHGQTELNLKTAISG